MHWNLIVIDGEMQVLTENFDKQVNSFQICQFVIIRVDA